MEYITARTFSSVYIVLDLIWVSVFTAILLYKHKFTAIFAGFLAGILYYLVDFGIFYHALGTRAVEGASPGLLLLWLSMSYGYTNFVWIWLLLEDGKHWLEWSLLPLLGWLTVGLLAQNFSQFGTTIHIVRGIKSYHGIMALILCVGYVILILRNLRDSEEKAPIGKLLLIGISVQFAWESALLISGIRPYDLKPLIINSLIETNLGMPYIYLIFRAFLRKKYFASY
jgi:hypothetical protein